MLVNFIEDQMWRLRVLDPPLDVWTRINPSEEVSNALRELDAKVIVSNGVIIFDKAEDIIVFRIRTGV